MTNETRDLSLGEALDVGCELAMAGEHDKAIGWFRGVLVHDPENFEAIQRLGASLFEQKKFHEALYWFWRGRKINRRHPVALTNYGLCLGQLGHADEGLPDLERAVAFVEKDIGFPDAVKALVYNNLGNTLERLGRYAEAMVALDKGIALNPHDPFPHYNRGIALLRLNRHRDGLAALDRSIALRSENDTAAAADAYYNRGTTKLLLGDLKGGFADYEYRLLTTENKQPNFGLSADKKWTGGFEYIVGKRLLVHCEQGLGDTIQFLRFVPGLVARGAKVSMICHAETRALAQQIEGVEVPEVGAPIEFDLWVPLLSLPLCCGVEREADIPPPWVPASEPERTEKWHWPVNSPGLLNVGICWAGNFRHKNDKHRSIPLATFARLFDTPGCNFVSLQQMCPEDTELFGNLQERGHCTSLRAVWLNDWRETAAVIRNLDLVISADTAVAHMAASIGVPTWILIPAFATDWRWQLERTDSPWYPAARLYRQRKIGDWASVIFRIRADIEAAGAA